MQGSTKQGRWGVRGVLIAGAGVAMAGSVASACPTCGEACSPSELNDLIASVCPDMGSMSMGAASQAEAASFNFAAAQSANAAATTNVYVYNTDFSTDSTGATAIDPVIHAGDTVHWVWVNGFHSVTSTAGSGESFNSGDKFNSGDSFDHTFNTPGTYQYYCDVHGFDAGNGNAGGMSGVITVLPVPEPTTIGTTLAVIGAIAARRRRG